MESERKPFLTPPRLLMLFGFVALTGVALFYLSLTWEQFYWLNQVNQAEQELQILKNERKLLRHDVSQAFSRQRIWQIATGQLGMERPDAKDGSLKFLHLIKK